MSVTEGQAHRRPTVTCSTDDVPVAARAALWRETIGASYPGLAVDWLADGPIRARFASRPFGDARVTDISNTPIRLAHRPQPGADRGYQLVLQLAGSGSYAHNGRDVVQEPGDLVLLDTALPFDSVFPVDLRVVVWDLPRALLAPLLAEPDEAPARRIRGGDGLGAVLAGYAQSLAAEAGRLDAPAEASLQLHLCTLAALALGAGPAARDAHRLSYRMARRQQVFAYIEAHFRDGGLTAERAARDLRMSRRWLHALLDDSELSFGARVARRRVEECRRLLDDPAYDHLSITDIAFGAGFNDLSTFNRQFRARYGMTPRDVRRRDSTKTRG
ncbi:MAG TPA: helix-turn-helix domain-containing protein [Alphaproteobacteria bacterium]